MEDLSQEDKAQPVIIGPKIILTLQWVKIIQSSTSDIRSSQNSGKT